MAIGLLIFVAVMIGLFFIVSLTVIIIMGIIGYKWHKDHSTDDTLQTVRSNQKDIAKIKAKLGIVEVKKNGAKNYNIFICF